MCKVETDGDREGRGERRERREGGREGERGGVGMTVNIRSSFCEIATVAIAERKLRSHRSASKILPPLLSASPLPQPPQTALSSRFQWRNIPHVVIHRKCDVTIL